MRLASLLLVLGLAAGCSDDPSPAEDLGPDLVVRDEGVDEGPPDLGPRCEPACSGGSSCCAGEPEPFCAALLMDVANCGSCGSDCVAEGKGTECMAGTCVCGVSNLGCGGTQNSFCCPPRAPGERPYCADLASSGLDCGTCDTACDEAQADRCNVGTCACGSTRRDGCAGTPADRCCANGLTGDADCVNTESDAFHCGACGNVCLEGQRCVEGTCTVGDPCPGGCEGGQVCCAGECCGAAACISAEEGCRS